MAKKFQLSELKVTSFVTTLSENEQKTSKGGYLGARRRPISHRAGRFDFTVYKTQVKVITATVYTSNKRSGK